MVGRVKTGILVNINQFYTNHRMVFVISGSDLYVKAYKENVDTSDG